MPHRGRRRAVIPAGVAKPERVGFRFQLVAFDHRGERTISGGCELFRGSRTDGCSGRKLPPSTRSGSGSSLSSEVQRRGRRFKRRSHEVDERNEGGTRRPARPLTAGVHPWALAVLGTVAPRPYFRNASRKCPRFFRADPLVWRAWPFALVPSRPVSAPVASFTRPRTLSSVPPALSRPLLRMPNSCRLVGPSSC